MKIAVTGEKGILCNELKRLRTDFVFLPKSNFDIRDRSIIEKLSQIDPDAIIHSAAVTDSKAVIRDPLNAIRTNIVGTSNICEFCIENKKRLVYISTDYVYPGDSGNYSELDPVYPHNEYAWTKLGGECAVKLVPNSLIIRTSFGSSKFAYDVAWTNLITSKDYIDNIAPKILKAALSNVSGVLNIGSDAKSMYSYACQRNRVTPQNLDQQKNFSLNLQNYEQAFRD